MRLTALALSLLLLDSPASVEEGEALFKAGRFQEAVKAFKKAASRDKQCGRCFLGMAAAQQALHQYRDAIKSCDRALEVGLATPAGRARAYNLKGLSLFRMADGGNAEKLKEAEALLRLALDADPADPAPLFNLGVVILQQARDEEGIAQLKAFLERVPEGKGAEAARRFIENPRRARERFAPSFSAVLADGQAVSLESLKGKVVVLDFWATWCAPCREAIPELKELVRKHGEKRFVLLSISVDEDEAAWRAFLKKNSMTWAHGLDAQSGLAQLFRVDVFPTYIVLDGEGVVRAEIRGTDPQHSLALRLGSTLESMAELKAH